MMARFSPLICVRFTGAVAAINSFYVALGSPSIPGWVASGGDPCGSAIPWQGIVCDDTSSISSM